jgi:SNF2 family DNA or RNA helicase
MELVKLLRQTKKGTWVRTPVRTERVDGRIFFYKPDEFETPFALKNEIKAMQGYRWHGHLDPDDGYRNGTKVWPALDSTRNNFQLSFLTGGNPYENWDKPLEHYQYERPLRAHQELMANHCLTYHYKILAAEMGTGKTLAAIEVLERSGFQDWWWVAPKSGLNAVDLEFDKWGLRFRPNLMTYDRLRMIMKNWKPGDPAPRGVIFDESSRLKGARSQRTKAAQGLADAIRKEYGWDGFCILMSGTPAPKRPTDWWAQCEVCYPGFLKEGTDKAFEQRLRIFEKRTIDGSTFYSPVAWRDDEGRCDECGQFEWIENEDPDDIEREGRWKLDAFGERLIHPNHDPDAELFGGDSHPHVPSKNEVAFLHERLDGLVLPLAKKDCWDLPDKQYREVVLEPTTTIKRVAKALLSAATTAIQGITWLRELSDGFQYKQEVDPDKPVKPCPVCKGEGECEQWFHEGEQIEAQDLDHHDLHENPLEYEKKLATCEICEGKGEVENLIKTTKEIRCPKEQAVRDLLEENEDQGRLVIFAGFRGSIDRIVKICHKQEWDVVRVDGRGWKVMKADGNNPTAKSVKPLHYWNDVDVNPRVVFVAHPESGGMGLTLTQSRMAVFYSNDFKPESRMQAEDRIHRPGIDENKGATIVDLFHLGSDRKVLNVLRDNRRLEQMTLGELQELEL